jgi:hypothetical protein
MVAFVVSFPLQFGWGTLLKKIITSLRIIKIINGETIMNALLLYSQKTSFISFSAAVAFIGSN